MPVQGFFDANTVPPAQGLDGHPPGMFPFVVSNTQCVENKAKDGGMFRVTMKSDVGEIQNNYNLWNQSPQAVEIANKELSALCHAVGIFRLDFSNDGIALRGGRGRMEVGPQKNNPNYMEVKRVFDIHGNEPGKPATAPAGGPPNTQQWGTAPNQQAPQQPPQQQGAAPLQQQPGGGWGTQQPQGGQQQPNSSQQGGWGGAPQNNAPPPNSIQPPPQQGGWQQPNQQGQATQQAPNQPPWATTR